MTRGAPPTYDDMVTLLRKLVATSDAMGRKIRYSYVTSTGQVYKALGASLDEQARAMLKRIDAAKAKELQKENT